MRSAVQTAQNGGALFTVFCTIFGRKQSRVFNGETANAFDFFVYNTTRNFDFELFAKFVDYSAGFGLWLGLETVWDRRFQGLAVQQSQFAFENGPLSAQQLVQPCEYPRSTCWFSGGCVTVCRLLVLMLR